MNKRKARKLLIRMPKPAPGQYLSTGSTLINLGISGHSRNGFLQGHYYRLLGDTRSGKTFLSLTCLAEASVNPVFNNYRFIHDDVERGALMEMEYFFGMRVAERLEAPSRTTDGEPQCSSTIEEFYYNVRNAITDGRPFIYILDSMDSLDSEQAQAKMDQQQKAYEQGKDAAGSMTDGKARYNSQNLRGLVTDLGKTKSILIVISQQRDNLGFGHKAKVSSGGKALSYYATIELQSYRAGSITRTVKGNKHSIGDYVGVKILKNRVQGRDRTVQLPIYHSYGIDDVESCIDWLLANKHWQVQKQSIIAPDLKFKGTKERLITYVHTKGLVRKLQVITANAWNNLERLLMVKRPGRRYV